MEDDCLSIFGLKPHNIGDFKGRGVWVPDGLTAREIGVGGEALMRDDSWLDLYKAQDLARTVLVAVKRDSQSNSDETP